jgi:hypothetical protein
METKRPLCVYAGETKELTEGDSITGVDSEYQPTYAVDLTIDFSLGSGQSVLLTGNVSLTLTNMINGHPYRLIMIQDSSGNRTASFVTTVKWPNATAPTLTTSGDKVDIFTFIKSRDVIYGDLAKTFY